METLLGFFAQSALVLLIGYLIYRLVFRTEGYFVFNRVYLLMILVLAVVLPLIPIHLGTHIGGSLAIYSVQHPLQAINHLMINEVTINAADAAIPVTDVVSWDFWFVVVYMIGVLIGVGRLAYRLSYLFRLVRISPKSQSGDITYVMLNEGTPVFSFFRYVFVTNEMMAHSDRNQQILTHEQQHVRQWHSLDILFCELVALVFWFNPFIYLIKKEVRENHELLADEGVLSFYPDPSYYRVLLVSHSTQLNSQLLTHNFSYSLLKRRLFMMKNVKHPVRMWVKSVWIFIALALMMVACSESNPVSEDLALKDATFTELNIPADSVSLSTVHSFDDMESMFMVTLGKNQLTVLELFNDKNQKVATLFDENMGPGEFTAKWKMPEGSAYFSYVLKAGDEKITGNFSSNPTAQYNTEKEVFTVVEQMPVFPGGMEQLIKFLSANITYPAMAKQEGIQGRVFVNFVVEADGSVTNVKVLRGIGGGCDEEAVRVVSSMPNWTPGMQRGEAVRVSYNIPIKFTLD